MRVVILGNSGSGKSSLARTLAGVADADILDLDTVAWEPHRPAEARAEDDALRDVDAFCRNNPQSWVIEGCYANLIEPALAYRPRLIFLNPGEAACLANCRARPWEPHKYASREAQDANLAFLLGWVSEYYRRGGAMSLAGHRACFERYGGPKRELTTRPDLGRLDPEFVVWLA